MNRSSRKGLESTHCVKLLAYNVKARTDFEREVAGTHASKVACFATFPTEWDAPQAVGNWHQTTEVHAFLIVQKPAV